MANKGQTAKLLEQAAENYAKITDHVRFFRTADGEAYGFTVGGKIYIDPRNANSETPIHEYVHLWASALKRGNAAEWKNVVGLMKGTKAWDDVVKNYPELKGNMDAIADEVIATYSGRRGAERLHKMAEDIPSGKAFEKTEAISTIAKVKRALDKFWKGVADMLHIHYTSAEEVADRVMKDLLDGVDPRKIATEQKKHEADNSAKKKSSANPVEGMERAATMYRKEQRARLQKKNSGKDGRIVPDDVERSVSSQIEKKFDEDIEGIAKDVQDKKLFRKKLAEDVERISRTPHSELETELEELKNNQNEEIRREKFGGTEGVFERGKGGNKQYPWALQDRATAAAIERELDYRRVRAESIRSTYGLQAGSEADFRNVSEGIEKANIGKELRSLSSKVSSVIKRLGVEINAKGEDKVHDAFGQSNTDRSVDYYIDKMARTSSSPIEQPTTIVHEMIHQGVDHAIHLVNSDKAEGVLTPKQIEAVNTILGIYQKAKIQPERFKENSYGLNNEYEFTAQMADPRQRKALELSVWDRSG